MAVATASFDENTGATPTDRLGFTLFLAIAIHGILLLGISFSEPETKPIKETLEITLAQYKSQQKPEDADFIAQANQQGSGTAEDKRRLSTTEQALFQDNRIRRQSAQQSPITAPEPEAVTPAPKAATQVKEKPSAKQEQGKHKVVTTQKPKPVKATAQTRKPETGQPAARAGSSSSLLARSLEIANLQAQLDLQQQEFAKRPRKKIVNSTSTLARADAQYMENWRREIERVGNINYPEEARRKKLYGQLGLLVAIGPDGRLIEVKILRSSGYPMLDDAAMRIVKLAAPFQPFPVEMRKTTDVLEIIRTWRFEKRTSVY